MGVEPHETYHYFGKARLDWGRGHRPNMIMEMTEAQVKVKEKAIHAHQNVYANPGARARREPAWRGRGSTCPSSRTSMTTRPPAT